MQWQKEIERWPVSYLFFFPYSCIINIGEGWTFVPFRKRRRDRYKISRTNKNRVNKCQHHLSSKHPRVWFHVSSHFAILCLSLIWDRVSCVSCRLALCAAVCTVTVTHGGKGKSNMVVMQLPPLPQPPTFSLPNPPAWIWLSGFPLVRCSACCLSDGIPDTDRDFKVL